MSAVLLLLALAQLGYGGERRDDGDALIGRHELAQARWEVAGGPFEVGAPLEALLVVEHGAGARVELDPAALDADPSWLSFAAPERADARGADRLTAYTTRWTWRLASLEAGERELPALKLRLFEGAAQSELEVEPARVQIEGVLAPGEDAPRPWLGFRPLEGELARARWLWIAAAGVASALLAAWSWARRRRRAPAAAPPSAEERLAALASRDLESAEVVRELHYELTALLRAAIDREQSVARAASTDDEWFARASATLAPARAQELGEILSAAAAVKYGAQRPTHWAVKDTLDKARRVVAGPRSAGVAA